MDCCPFLLNMRISLIFALGVGGLVMTKMNAQMRIVEETETTLGRLYVVHHRKRMLAGGLPSLRIVALLGEV